MKKENEMSLQSARPVEDKSRIVLTLYMMIMGAGLAATHFGKKISYSDPGFLSAMLPWTVLLAGLVLVVQFHEGKKFGFQQRSNGKFGIYLVVMVPVILLFGYAVVECHSSITPVMIVMPILIGIAEEGMYRGILLPALFRKRTVNTAILISAFWFSALHALNLLGGQSILAVIGQLLLTFLTGLYFAAVYIRIKRLSLLILQHALWDFVAFSGVVERTPVTGFAIALITVMQFICVFAMLMSYREKNSTIT